MISIERLDTCLVDLPTIRPHKLAMHTLQRQTLVLLRLTCSDGSQGLGEATTIGGLAYARSVSAATIGFTCNPDAELDDVSDLVIRPVVGPEVISGSTRMKAGTATKMVLNMLTTGTMIRLGKTYGNLMVDLRATNSKLTDRARRIVKMLTGVDDAEAQSLLDRAAGELKTAVVMHERSVSADEARRLLSESANQLRTALNISPIPSPLPLDTPKSNPSPLPLDTRKSHPSPLPLDGGGVGGGGE